MTNLTAMNFMSNMMSAALTGVIFAVLVLVLRMLVLIILPEASER